MAGPGRVPKPTHMVQNPRKKSTKAVLVPVKRGTQIPDIPNPDDREFHRLTVKWWDNVWTSPMASEYLETDIDGLGRVALLIDEYYKNPAGRAGRDILAELRLQEARFGLSPIDRSRLQWEVQKGEEAQKKRQPQRAPQSSGKDPRSALG